jgi:hypothetical protein
MDKLERLFDVPTLAKMWNVSEWTIRCYLSKKTLARTKIGRRTMISESDALAFVQSQNR